MRSRRAGLLEVLAMALAAAGTTWLATLAWRGFTRDPGNYLVPLLVVALTVALTGAALRRLRLPGAVVLLGQLVVSGMAVHAVLTGSLLPLGNAAGALLDEVAVAADNAQRYRAPVPEEGSVAPLLVLGGWACLLLVDLLASTARRVSLAGLPLLAIYSVPVSMLGGGVAWWVFALTAGGFLTMLYVQHSESVDRWGRSLERPGDSPGRAPSVRASAGSVGAAATGLAVFAPLLVPTLSIDALGFGPGEGSGSDIAVENPMTDLRRDLRRGDDVPLLRLTTDDPSPSYLRIAVLNRFNDNEWSTGDRDIPVEQQAEGQIPLPERDKSIRRTQHDYRVTGLPEFESRWLPTQFPLSRISAEGDWRYDTETLDFLAADDDLDTAGLSYTFTGVDLDIEAELLADAPSSAGEVDSAYRELPGDFPAMVDNLALEVTRDYPSRYEKAVALQNWFREDGGFTYDLEDVPTGSGPDELVQFLTEGGDGRRGYCEQFASAMAAMARSLGIPARVAVGFLVPRELAAPDTYEYSAHDMHSWPELYFTGAGWVRFEPTPPDRANDVPPYTEQALAEPPAEGPSAGPSNDPGRSQTLGADPRLDEGAIPEGQSPTADAGFPWARVLGAGLAVVVVALLLLPRVVRQRRSASRLSGAPEPAWQELEATARDLGVPWPEDRSPRQTRDRLLAHLGPTDAEAVERPRRGPAASPDGVAALDRLVLSLERLRYSHRQGAADGEAVVADTRTVVAALHGGADQRARRRARWWPASVLPWRRRTASASGEQQVLVRHGAVVDHVG